MGIGDTPKILVLNKLDLMVETEYQPLDLEVIENIDTAEFNRVVTTSATKSWGIKDLRNAVESELNIPSATTSTNFISSNA